MGIVETWDDMDTRERTASAAAVTPELKGPTLEKIATNPQESVLFAKFMEEGGNDDLLNKFVTHKLDASEMGQLLEQHHHYLEVRERTRQLKEHINANMAKFVADTPEMRQLQLAVGHENLNKIFQKYLDEFSITDPSRFEDMEAVMKNLADQAKESAKFNGRFKEISEENKLTPKEQEEYLKAMMGRSPNTDIQDLLLKKIGKGRFGLGYVKKFFTSNEKLDARAEAMDISKDAKQLIEDIRTARRVMGGLMSDALFNNADMRAALNRHMAGVQEKKPESYSLSEGYKLLKTEVDKEDLKKRYKKAKDEAVARHPAGGTPFDEDQFLADWTKQEGDVMTGKGKKEGLFRKIFAALVVESLKNLLK